MTSLLKDCIRWMTPFGLIQRHRLRFQMNRLGLPETKEVLEAVLTCRYELWPQALRQRVTPWALVDVGANDGSFVRAVQRLAPLSAVYAFEPQKECQASLIEILNKIPNSNIFQAAVSDHAGTIDLICTQNNKLSSVLNPTGDIGRHYCQRDFELKQKVSVPLLRLDDVIPIGMPIGMVKIDVQGYELAVLNGAVETLKRTSAVLLELNYVAHYEGGATFDQIHSTMHQLGFKTYGVSEPFIGPDGPLWADAMFVKKYE